MAHAGGAVLIVVGQEQFDLQALRLARPPRVSLDAQARAGRGDAGGGEHGCIRVGLGRDLHQADTTGAGGVIHVVQLAEARDIDAVAAGAGQNGLFRQGLEGLAVDGQ